MLEIDEVGNRFWYNERDEFHRIDGPAIEWNDGTKEWWIKGSQHRMDGPAIEYKNSKQYWLNDNELTTSANCERSADLYLR